MKNGTLKPNTSASVGRFGGISVSLKLKKRLKRLLSLCLFLLVAQSGLLAQVNVNSPNPEGAVNGAHVIDFDLADMQNVTIDLPAGTRFRVQLINILPYNATYRVTMASDKFDYPPLSLVGLNYAPAESQRKKGFHKPKGDSCVRALKDLLEEKISNAKDESALRSAKLALDHGISEFKGDPADSAQDDSACQAAINLLEIQKEEVFEKTDSLLKAEIPIEAGHVVEVTITRPYTEEERQTAHSGSGSEAGARAHRTWRLTVYAGRRSGFEVVYGFTFITNGFSRTKEYFTEATPAGDYRIQGGSVRGYDDVDLHPIVMAAYFPKGFLFGIRGVRFGPAAGVTVANSSAVLAAGVLLSFYKNFGIGIGVAAHPIRVLMERYRREENRTVNEPLTFDQISDPKYQFDPFVSFTFRFDANPFDAGASGNAK
ncbi:MAG TPA: hypothetical protein VN285_01430 [Candidatus Deferrimicrobium sp.]|nr:hypothetical protein [Candidatus Deferrimicrobium sp.]